MVVILQGGGIYGLSYTWGVRDGHGSIQFYVSVREAVITIWRKLNIWENVLLVWYEKNGSFIFNWQNISSREKCFILRVVCGCPPQTKCEPPVGSVDVHQTHLPQSGDQEPAQPGSSRTVSMIHSLYSGKHNNRNLQGGTVRCQGYRSCGSYTVRP